MTAVRVETDAALTPAEVNAAYAWDGRAAMYLRPTTATHGH